MRNPINIPKNLIFDESKIEISFDDQRMLNRTATSVVIEGNPNGFLSLSNCLIYLANALETKIDLSQFVFVKSTIRLEIVLDESIPDTQVGTVARLDDLHFVWTLSEHDSNSVFTGMHSLGHLNFELHLDDGKKEFEISVYCSVMDS